MTPLPSNCLDMSQTHSAMIVPMSSFTEVTIDEVRKLLTFMPAKSSLVDFVPTSVVKACPELFAEIIAKLANLSFGEGRFPKNQVCLGEAFVKERRPRQWYTLQLSTNIKSQQSVQSSREIGVGANNTTTPYYVTKLQQSTVGLSTESLHGVGTVENARCCI